MFRTQTAISLGWIASSLFTFATQLPLERESQETKPPSLLAATESDSPKMKRGSEKIGELSPELST